VISGQSFAIGKLFAIAPFQSEKPPLHFLNDRKHAVHWMMDPQKAVLPGKYGLDLLPVIVEHTFAASEIDPFPFLGTVHVIGVEDRTDPVHRVRKKRLQGTEAKLSARIRNDATELRISSEKDPLFGPQGHSQHENPGLHPDLSKALPIMDHEEVPGPEGGPSIRKGDSTVNLIGASVILRGIARDTGWKDLSTSDVGENEKNEKE
jgi:hypothetical protein